MTPAEKDVVDAAIALCNQPCYAMSYSDSAEGSPFKKHLVRVPVPQYGALQDACAQLADESTGVSDCKLR